MQRLVRVCALAVLAAACGGGGSTGPSGASVSGTWDLSVTGLTGNAITCGASTTITLTQQGDTFTGNHNIATLVCTQAGVSDTTVVPAGSVLNGKVTGSSVSFDLDGSAQHQTGSVAGTSMSGTANWTADFGPPTGTVILVGHWTATKR